MQSNNAEPQHGDSNTLSSHWDIMAGNWSSRDRW